MSWKDRYDRITCCFEGDIIIFGGHYTKKECLTIIDEDNYDDPDDYKNHKVRHVYVKFGLVHDPYDDRVTNGFAIKDDPKKGRIKGTLFTE